MIDTNYYKILQIDPAADPEVVQAAYRRLAQKYHPDANAASEATRRMQEINEAYEVLRDPVRRADFDRRYAGQEQQPAAQSAKQGRQQEDAQRSAEERYQAHTEPAYAQFPIEFNLPEGEPELSVQAAEAIHKEFRAWSHWKQLRSRKVLRNKQAEDESLFLIDVGQAIEFDWNWEGATALRPADLDNFDPENIEGVVSTLWSGEVVEVDQTKGQLFINATESEHPPTSGTFFVKPFEFLFYLDSVYRSKQFDGLHKILPARLNACLGGTHPLVAGTMNAGQSNLKDLWRHSWSILWGPPGTGKTYHIGEEVAACIENRAERVLVVSTTNAATDGAAIKIGELFGPRLKSTSVLRVGKGARYSKFTDKHVESLLKGTEADQLRQIEELVSRLESTYTLEDKAHLRKMVQELRRSMKDPSFDIFLRLDVQAVVTTAFNAVRLLANSQIAEMIGKGNAPFTTIIIDEAGLLSRATIAALSLLAAKRTILVGDPKQLSPISKESRTLPSREARWLGSSALTHLDRGSSNHSGVCLLREQHRMHPDICAAISHYQYADNPLENADEVKQPTADMPALLGNVPRAIWYVLDEDFENSASIRADRGAGNKSWVRPATKAILDKFFSEPGMRATRGLFISPFIAQVRDVAQYLQNRNIKGWSAGTVHSQQGTEIDIVIFDTVNAGSCGWPPGEWRRIVNVGLSRAKHFVMLLASRAEMEQQYLKPLMKDLLPYVLVKSRGRISFSPVTMERQPNGEHRSILQAQLQPELLGNQLEMRRTLRPLLSHEQQRLVELTMDGKPRVVRGVAGSGKTLVLANWLQQIVSKFNSHSDIRIWVVYANAALVAMIHSTIEQAWAANHAETFPWDRVETLHIKEVLRNLQAEMHLPRMQDDDFEYDHWSRHILSKQAAEKLAPRCQAMFIDEAQDMGSNTLKLLIHLVEQADKNDPKSRAVHIFYDNAQTIYDRGGTPKWSELGLNVLGRSTVMKESYRATRPITELALNVLYRLQPPDTDDDFRELIERELIEATLWKGTKWWKVRFNHVDGPNPRFRKFETAAHQIKQIALQIRNWIEVESVKPEDITILCNQTSQCEYVAREVGLDFANSRIRIHFQNGRNVRREMGFVLVTTPHSFKGYDSEIIIVAHAESFVRGKPLQPLPNNLYVAMTRARSLLEVYAVQADGLANRNIIDTIEACLDVIEDYDSGISSVDDFEDLARMIGYQHRDWLKALRKSVHINQEPLSSEGEILAQPAFWFENGLRIIACFVEQPSRRVAHRLEDLGIRLIKPGESYE